MWSTEARVHIDSSGNWWPMKFSLYIGGVEYCNLGTTSALMANAILYITLSLQWTVAAAGNNCIPQVGHCQRLLV
jgi:hypothetical protein